MNTPLNREKIRKHIPKKLRNRVRIYLVMALIIFGVIAFRLFQQDEYIFYAVGLLIFGVVVGFFVARMYKVTWDHGAEEVVSRLDTYGIIFLIAYIAFEILGEQIIRQFFIGPTIITLILSLAGGAILGRGIGMGRVIMRVLRDNV